MWICPPTIVCLVEIINNKIRVTDRLNSASNYHQHHFDKSREQLQWTDNDTKLINASFQNIESELICAEVDYFLLVYRVVLVTNNTK